MCFYRLSDVDTESFLLRDVSGDSRHSDGGEKQKKNILSFHQCHTPTTQDRVKIFSSTLTIAPEESVSRLGWPFRITALFLYTFIQGGSCYLSLTTLHPPSCFQPLFTDKQVEKKKVSSRRRHSLKLSGKYAPKLPTKENMLQSC